jgi:hypothetical protein
MIKKLSLWILIIQLIINWFPPLIWQHNLLLLSNKNKPCNFNSLSSLRCVGLVLFNIKQPLPYTLGGRDGIFTNVWSFRSPYCICNCCWISVITLKVEFNFIVKYPKSSNQAYYFCVFSMERRWNMSSPWYLMLVDKSSKVECKFCDNVISYHKDRMHFHLNDRYDGKLELEL